MFWFWLKFHWSLIPRVHLPIFQHWFRNGLALTKPQAIIWTNADYFIDTYMRHSPSMSYAYSSEGLPTVSMEIPYWKHHILRNCILYRCTNIVPTTQAQRMKTLSYRFRGWKQRWVPLILYVPVLPSKFPVQPVMSNTQAHGFIQCVVLQIFLSSQVTQEHWYLFELPNVVAL